MNLSDVARLERKSGCKPVSDTKQRIDRSLRGHCPNGQLLATCGIRGYPEALGRPSAGRPSPRDDHAARRSLLRRESRLLLVADN